MPSEEFAVDAAKNPGMASVTAGGNERPLERSTLNGSTVLILSGFQGVVWPSFVHQLVGRL